MKEQLVSIVTPMKNASAYISQTIDSVLNQKYENWEMFIVDDCSCDGGKSVEIVKKYTQKDSRIHLYELPAGKGSSGARNEGLKHVKGHFLAFLDSDDIWHPEYLQTMLEKIEQNKTAENGIKNVAVYYCGYRRMNEDCTAEIRKPYSCAGIKGYKDFLRFCPIFPSISIYDLEKINQPLKFREELHSLRDDYVFVLDILQQNLLALGFEDILADYRIRPDSITASKLKMTGPQWKVYREVLGINWLQSCFYLSCWAVNGVKKYWRLIKK